MKKFLAILLAMMLALVSVAALASGDVEDPNAGNEPAATEPAEGGNAADIDYTKGTTYSQAATAPFTVEIDKTYAFTVLEGATIPAHTLTFSVEATGVDYPGAAIDMDNLPEVTVDDVVIPEAEAGEETSAYPVTINMPAFPEVGVYNYTITEDNTNVAGVTYHTSPWYLRVTVVRTEAGELQVAGIALREEETDHENPDQQTKIDSLDNEFSSGSVKIKKIVTGNMGDYSKDWHITVTFSSAKHVWNTIKYTTVDGVEHTITPGWSDNTSVEITLKHNEEVTFENVPTDVSYTYTETEADQDGYTTTYSNEEAVAIAAAETKAEEIENNKEVTPDTGITLESMPYVLMMALSLAGFVVLKLRKREEA